MSKTVISPLKRWAGSVTIADPLTLIQAQTIEEAMEQMEVDPETKKTVITLFDAKRRPAIMACVEKWDLENFTLLPDGSPPFSPRLDSHNLISWLFSEIAAVYFGESVVPNESSPTPTTTPATDVTAES